FFFQEPDIVTTPEMPGHKLNYYEILRKVASADPDFNEIEKILKRDVSLTYKLLRFINSASYGFKVTVRSIRHALALLGKRELRKWLTLIALGGLGAGQTKELMTNALIRSRFCELIGKELNLKDETADLFLVGMFSVADAMLNRSMEMICGDLPLDTEIKSALLGEVGLFRDVLEFVTAYEKARWKETARIAKKLKLPEGRFVANYLESVQWAREF
ncbi:MAG: HDOD domain-containing protein, partial [bacterium]|nr:HDOD domain-containing protein [bacterium]